jgi:hypothetical protein
VPLQQCQLDGKPGFQWGDGGKCYTYDAADAPDKERARRAALEQGRAMMVHKEQIVELFAQGQILEGATVDRASLVIQNVKLLGRESKNGRRYSDQALQDAVRLYKGAPFYLDHPRDDELRERQGARSVLDLAGRVLSARQVGDAVRGDVQILDREPVKSLLFALAEQMPEMAGNSHRVAATLRPGAPGEPDLVESIEEVFGVELVTNPATAASLFESITHGRTDMKDVTLDKLKAERPDLVQALVKEQQTGGELERIKAENADLKKKVDEGAARDALRARKDLIATKLAEAKLPEVLVTALFKQQLEEAKDEAAITALLAERQELAGSVKVTGPVSVERNLDEGRKKAGKGPTPVDEAKIGDYGRQLGVV